MSRRTYLLTIANLEKYREQLFNYVYYGIIPDTVDSKDVKDSGKTKTIEIQGNGEIANQLAKIGNKEETTTDYGITYSTIQETGIATFRGTNTASSNKFISLIWSATATPIYTNHKYLVKWNVKGTKPTDSTARNNLFGSNFGFDDKIVDGANNTSYCQITIVANATVDFSIRLQIFDLTLRYGAGLEPTSMSDPRVIKLLNSSYMAFNLGEHKESVVNEIELAPYNLFDGAWTIELSNQKFTFSHYVEVIAGVEYTAETTNMAYQAMYFHAYDQNYNSLGDLSLTVITSSSRKALIPVGCKYIKVEIYNSSGITQGDFSFHRTGSRTGYVAHGNSTKISLPNPLKIGGAMRTHNTLEITSTSFVFTRNIWKVDLGSLSFTLYNNNLFYATVAGGVKNVGSGNPINILCEAYPCNSVAKNGGDASTGSDKTCSYDATNNQVLIRDTAYLTASDFATAVANKYFYFPLATPQVITIPKRHLACVDLGTLSWGAYSSGTGKTYYAVLDSNGLGSDSFYCSNYLKANAGQETGLSNLSGCLRVAQGLIFIRDDNYASATDFKNAMSGVYIWYETENEVADFVNKARFERGGTITTKEFTWIENQLVIAERPTQTTNDVKFTNNGDGTITVVGTASAQSTFSIPYSSNYPSLILGHKYLLYGCANGGSVSTFDLRMNNIGTIYNYNGLIATSTITGKDSIYILVRNGVSINATFMPKLVDLTVGFGAGKEPATLDDWRIKYILEHGNIPTNLTGTSKSVDSETLPNLDMKIQVK